MNADKFDVTVQHGAAILELNRANCLDIAGKHALTSAVLELRTRTDIRALIISSGHPHAFLVDVAELADMSAEEAGDSASGHRLGAALEELPFPVIAAVEGAALGGGCELALACDLTIAGAAATFGQIEAMGGVMPAFGGTWRLARRVGFQRACEMMFTGNVIDAPMAESYGLILALSPVGGALSAAQQLTERIKKTSRSAIAAIKRAVHAGWNVEPSRSDSLEESNFPQLFGSEQSERMHAFLKQQEVSAGQ